MTYRCDMIYGQVQDEVPRSQKLWLVLFTTCTCIYTWRLTAVVTQSCQSSETDQRMLTALHQHFINSFYLQLCSIIFVKIIQCQVNTNTVTGSYTM